MDRTAIEWALSLVRDGTLSVDAEGRIWRHATTARGRRKAIPARRAENVGGKGYLRLTLQIPGTGLVQVMAHRLVWESLRGPIPDDLQINHRDLDKQNNRPHNLELVSGAENIRHSYAHGRPAPWSRVDRRTARWRGKPMVSPETRAAIRAARAAGATYPELAARFGVAVSHAHRLCTQEPHGQRSSRQEGGGNGT